MATIDIHDLSGKKVGTLQLADEVFGAINEDLLWEAVKHYRAGQRAGTHATKNKKLVSGAGKKLWKQKGTGRAVAAVAARRHSTRAESAFACVPFSAQEADGRAAFGAGGEAG
jgi:ribosomal protein L4